MKGKTWENKIAQKQCIINPASHVYWNVYYVIFGFPEAWNIKYLFKTGLVGTTSKYTTWMKLFEAFFAIIMEYLPPTSTGSYNSLSL